MPGFASELQPVWLTGLRVQAKLIVALMLRDALRRHGHHNLGMFWVIAEPMLLTFGVMVLWTVTKMTHGTEVGAIPFALTGYSFITIWRHLSSRTLNIMRINVNLRFHRRISFLDIILAMMLMETIGIFSAFIIAYLPFSLLGLCPVIRDPLILVGGFLLSAWFAASFGLIIAGLSELSHLVAHILPPLLYITLPFSGAFTMVDWLPKQYQDIMLWSPLVNGIEMFRGGLFSLDYPTHWNAGYLLAWCLVLTGVGIPLCSHASKSVEMAG